MIISLVCITEKSFVSAVKTGSDKVYQHAKEDYDRHKENREIKKEEKRQLREEQKVQGVNLNSTDLTKDGVLAKMSAADEEEVAESAAYREAFEREERALRNAVSGKTVKTSADEFTGKITKTAAVEEEIPFEEDSKKDDDIFVSRDSKTFREMRVFEESYVLNEETISNAELEMERAPKSVYEQKLPPETEFTGKLAESFQVPEERSKKVVTASGKVIETDTEEIVKKKLEKRKMDLAEKEEAENTVLQEIKKTEEKPKKPYVFPSLDLLARGKGLSAGQSDKEFRETAIKLQQTLRNFGVGVTVTNISCGPTVTRYELQPEQGVKVSKIQALADDIKLNLAATDIRIEAPIPGKAAVGIEVPNKVNSMVYLRELLESNEFKKHPSKLAFAVGKDIGGQVIVADIAKMPHLLIAGQTGSGKSVGINTMIMSLIYRSSPEDVKLIMIDPKVVELSVYNGIPHLLIPVVTDPKKAAGALNWAVAEMMERYNKFAQSNVRDIKGYNAKVQNLIDAGDVPQDQIPTKLPQLVIIIDELADLMMVASNEVE
ncbi:MAG: DNA translocase FtsK, partial [Lachnospiraceae bacterium]|nr:DNA translocase FtsK [Lachnospiraceae bacterium]